MTERLSTGSSCIDGCLEGGIAAETVTLIYGEPETGKTTLAIQCAANCALRQKLKTLFIDCDNTFSTERLSQITQEEFSLSAEQIILMKPKNFAEQTAVVDNLSDYTERNFGLVIIDTFNSLYRAKIAETSTKPKASFAVNRELNRQMAILAQTAKTRRIPVVITSQVTAVFNQTFVGVAPVATRVLRFWADNVLALKPTENPQVIKAVLEKNRNPQEATCYLRISQTGIHDLE
ncbi:MAG: AAA family ATPase [Candidatus Bathyarchaeota archaeon]|nr:AAA family ATPase [Candidatus Bathyarchaeota archaeon]